MKDSISFTLRSLAHLLRYPDADMRGHLVDIHTALNAEKRSWQRAPHRA